MEYLVHAVVSVLHVLYLNNLFALLGKEKELDPFVLAAVLGFHSICGSITSSYFIFGPAELKKNYVTGSQKKISSFLIKHFCSPSGTVLDISNDSTGMRNCKRFCQPPLNVDVFIC